MRCRSRAFGPWVHFLGSRLPLPLRERQDLARRMLDCGVCANLHEGDPDENRVNT